MSYRTILVHLNDSRRARKLLQNAAEIARACEARLIGLHVSPTFHGRAVDPTYPHTPAIEGLRFSRDEEADQVRSIFKQITDEERFGGEFRRFSGEFCSLAAENCNPFDIVAARAHTADLVIASQTDRDLGLSALLDFPEQIAVRADGLCSSSRTPANVGPCRRSRSLPGNQQREATRAMYEALPLLKDAQSVELLTIDERNDRAPLDPYLNRHLPASAVAEALAAHEVKAATVTLNSSGAPIGRGICARAEEQRADLVVMGAYGHSRLRELVLGGATQHVLSHMTVPTFFSH